MSWRTVVISKNAKLDYQLGYLVVRNQDVVKIHIRNQPNISTRYWHLHPTRRQERNL